MGKSNLTIVGLLIALSGTMCRPLLAQADSGWVGKRVMQTASNITLVANGEAVERTGRGISFFQVEQVDGRSVRVSADAGRTSGWASADELVLVDHAVDFFTRKIRTNPNDGFSHAARAFLWRDKGELDKALRDDNEAIRIDPKVAAYCYERGLTWHLRESYDHAIADFDQAIRIDPRFAPAFIARGAARAARKEFGHAIADYSEAVWLDPLAITAYEQRALAWHAKNEFAKAIIDDNMAIRLDARRVPAYCDRARAWTSLGKFDKAIADFGEALHIDQSCASAHGGRAWIWSTCPIANFRDGKKAVESATRACELTAWKDARLLDVLAAACAEAGDFESAIKWQTRADALYPAGEQLTRGQARLTLFRENKPVRDPAVQGQAVR
jgi:tetratricopeptide (TPR) repeat protein